jgi:hypothetical protein
LPIKEIGKVLFKGQVTEEEVHNYGRHSDESKSKKGNDTFPFVPSAQHHSRISELTQKVNTAIHLAETIPPHFVPEIITPPPNSIS